MEQNKKSNKKIWIGLILAAVLVAALVILYLNFGSKTREDQGAVHIQAEVILADGTSTTYDFNTDELFLRGALEEKKLIEGTESEFGLFVKTVDGVTVNEANKEWWCFTKNKETMMNSVDTTPIEDGDHFEITFTVGY